MDGYIKKYCPQTHIEFDSLLYTKARSHQNYNLFSSKVLTTAEERHNDKCCDFT